MRIGVTGASGFVGRHVLNALAARPNVEPVVLTRAPLDGLPAGIAQIACDIGDAGPGTYSRLGRVDMLLHTAWGGLPNYRSLHHLDEQLPAQFRFLRRMVEEGLPALLVTGTCYEYGMNSGELVENRAAAPSNPYGFAKATLLRQLEFLQDGTSFGLTWARLFYMYGGGQAPTAIFPLLCAAVARGDTLFPMSGGEQLRDYLPVEEVAACLVALAVDHHDAGIVNICSGRPVSIRRLVEEWIAGQGWAIKPELGRYAYPDYEPLAFWGSRRKLDGLIGPQRLASANDLV